MGKQSRSRPRHQSSIEVSQLPSSLPNPPHDRFNQVSNALSKHDKRPSNAPPQTRDEMAECHDVGFDGGEESGDGVEEPDDGEGDAVAEEREERGTEAEEDAGEKGLEEGPADIWIGVSGERSVLLRLSCGPQ